jgi:hypothetical protein
MNISNISYLFYLILRGRMFIPTPFFGRPFYGTGVSDDSEVQEADGETPGNPMRWVEEIFAHHLAHFQSFFEGGLVATS